MTERKKVRKVCNRMLNSLVGLSFTLWLVADKCDFTRPDINAFRREFTITINDKCIAGQIR